MNFYYAAKPYVGGENMNVSIDSTMAKLDPLGALTALCAGGEKFSSMQGSDGLSECVVRECVEKFGLSSAWLYGISENNAPFLQACYPHGDSSASYQHLAWSDEKEIIRLVGGTMHSLVPEILRNPEVGNGIDTIRTTSTADSLNAIASVPLICKGVAIGALALCSEDVQFFSAERIRFFQVYTQQAAFAIYNSQLIASLQMESRERLRTEQCWRGINDELDERIRKRTAQLEESNEELEAFSYSISHDLRAPLLAVKTLVEQLVEEDSPFGEAESRVALSAIQQSAAKMSNLIENLLNFSRTTRMPIRKSEIDMTALVRSIVDELLQTESGYSLTVSITPLLAADGDAGLIRQVWTNLLLNAFKFTRTKPIREITVTSYEADDDIVYTVADNGVGFDMKYTDKLFGVFQRLHSEEEFEGTGVGLSIVQRIVRRHGGRVWAEAEVDRGAKFHFSIPLNQSLLQ